MNLILIIIDSLRADHVGINGNPWIRTPNLDKLGAESVRFTKAYSESLMTIPARKAIHTGKRTFPFRDWVPYKHWPAPGWTPIPEGDDTISEILQENGYRTAFFTDCYHMFKPGMNFHRGFDEWRWIRGQEFDDYRTGSRGKIDPEKHFTEKQPRDRLPAKLFPKYLRNVELRTKDEDYFTPQVFNEGIRWLEENYDSDKFFLCIDNFDPHEPWDPPQYYRDMYNPGYEGKEVILPIYMQDYDYLTEEQLKQIRALYAGSVTMVDEWLGRFIDKVEQLGMMDDTAIVVMSDHGHMLGENKAIGKLPDSMFPGLMDLVFFVKHPNEKPKVIDNLVYNHDLFPTIFHLLGMKTPEQAQGVNLWDFVEGKQLEGREYVTSRAKQCLYIQNSQYVLLCRPDGSEPRLFDIQKDAAQENNIAADNPDVVKQMYEVLREDAGGDIPDLDLQWKF